MQAQTIPTYTADELIERMPLYDINELNIVNGLIGEERHLYSLPDLQAIYLIWKMCYKDQKTRLW